MDGKGLSRAPAVSVHLWPGGRGSSALPRVHESSIQLISPPPSPPCFSLLGVGVLTLFGIHHLVRVMPGRKSSLSGPPRSGRPRGRAFGRESKTERGGKEGVMQRAALTPGERLPGTWRTPMHLGRRRLRNSGEGLAASRAMGAAKAKSLGLRAALHGPRWPSASPRSPEHSGERRLPARPPLKSSLPRFLLWAVHGSVLRNGWSTVPASDCLGFPPSPEQLADKFLLSLYHPFASAGKKRCIPEWCMVTHCLLSSFEMLGEPLTSSVFLCEGLPVAH